MGNIRLAQKQRLASYRKIAIASWKHPRDPSTYSWLDLPTEPAEAFLKQYPASVRPSLTHYIAKIVAHCLEKHPDLNHLLRGRNLYRRERTDIFITTLLKTRQGLDLSGFTLFGAAERTLGELAQLSKDACERLKDGTDLDHQRVARVVERTPGWLLGPVFRIQGFFQYTLNLSLERLGIPDDKFGSAMITNFGPLGIENALVPLSPYCRCPLILGVGRPRPIAIVREKEVVAAECVVISFTFDHRYADGAHGAQMLRLFQKIFVDPDRYAHIFDARPVSGEASS
jgi:pyruvate dehydrogenase E2 component (dihydrolipoamide acetyltransferase)